MTAEIVHGLSAYSNGKCRCDICLAAHRPYRRNSQRRKRGITAVGGTPDPNLDRPWILVNFPVAIVARQAFPDDNEAIRVAFGDAS